jgi:autotransporter-associated beta strand protein
LDGVPLGDATTDANGNATLANLNLAGLQAGSYAGYLSVSFAGDASYLGGNAATNLIINPAPLTVTADNQTRLYGAADPTFTVSYSGFVNGETLATSGITGAASLTAADTADSPVGSYTIAIAADTLAAQNYAFTLVNGTLTVTQETIAVASAEVMATLTASSNVQVVIQSGGSLTVDAPLLLDAGGAVRVLEGGTLAVSGIEAAAGAVGITLDDGTLQADGDLSTAAPITIGGGATVNTNGFHVTIDSNLASTWGGLCKIGAGTLTLSGNNSYGGDTLDSGGTLELTSAAALSSMGSLVVSDGNCVVLDDSGAGGAPQTAVLVASPSAAVFQVEAPAEPVTPAVVASPANTVLEIPAAPAKVPAATAAASTVVTTAVAISPANTVLEIPAAPAKVPATAAASTVVTPATVSTSAGAAGLASAAAP